MLFSVTLNGQVTKIVMISGSVKIVISVLEGKSL